MKMTDKLKPCPFCESNHTERLFNSFGSIILVRCHSCGAYRQSVSQWNHRPLETALAESEKRGIRKNVGLYFLIQETLEIMLFDPEREDEMELHGKLENALTNWQQKTESEGNNDR